MALDKYRELEMFCEQRVREVLDPTDFEISGVYAGMDWDTKQPYCVVDFRRKGFSPDIECDEYCRDSVEHFAYDECEGDEECLDELEQECVVECEDNVKKIVTGSIQFDPVTLKVHSATIPTGCDIVWGDEETPVEDLEAEIESKIGMFGCEPEGTSWIHPHEMIPIETPELGYEEYPAMCYYHIKGCNLRSLAKIMKDGIV